jgi:hypothetical protein
LDVAQKLYAISGDTQRAIEIMDEARKVKA